MVGQTRRIQSESEYQNRRQQVLDRLRDSRELFGIKTEKYYCVGRFTYGLRRSLLEVINNSVPQSRLTYSPIRLRN